jgi:hypothetical protein
MKKNKPKRPIAARLAVSMIATVILVWLCLLTPAEVASSLRIRPALIPRLRRSRNTSPRNSMARSPFEQRGAFGGRSEEAEVADLAEVGTRRDVDCVSRADVACDPYPGAARLKTSAPPCLPAGYNNPVCLSPVSAFGMVCG